jgi:SH3-like domain-containing protein
MTDQHQHRATPEQWERITDPDGVASWVCILELRDRIAALEAAQLEQSESHRFCVDAIVRRVEAMESPMTELRAASAEARPAGGLVEMIEAVAGGDARAAIREVAEWLKQQQEVPIGSSTASADYFAAMLREEANRG